VQNLIVHIKGPAAAGVRATARLTAVGRTGLMDAAAEESFDRLTALARRLTGAPFAFLTVVDDERSYWLSRQGIPADGPEGNTVAESFCQYVVDSGEPLVLGDVVRDERTRDNPSIASMGVRAWAGFPVHTPDGEILGTFCVVDTRVRDWSAADVALVQDLAEVASGEVALLLAARRVEESRVAAEAAAVEAETATALARREAERANLLARISDLLTVGLDLDDVWQAIAALAVPAIGDFAFVYAVARDGGLVPVATRHRDPSAAARLTEWARSAGRRTGESVGPGRVAQTGQVELVEPAVRTDLTVAQRAAVRLLDVGCALVAPLAGRGEVAAVITIGRTSGSAPYTDDDRALVEALAGRAGLVVENAMLFQAERALSETMQRALLPALLPRPAGLRMAARYRPAGRALLVGGDWYDAYLDAAGTTSLVIGDVAGHDIDAAAAMGQLRTMLRMAGHDAVRTADEVLATVDRACATFGFDVFATALVAQIGPATADTTGRSVRWSSAGHPPPLLLHPDGAVRVLDDRPGLPLGVAPDRVRPGRVGTLPVGGTLLLYTDGLIESRGHDLDHGLARLVALVAGSAALDPEELCDRIVGELLPATGADDDVALIAVRVAAL
jgi:serine phosphatase RsbU (regulator of sigma subunit)